MPETMTKQSANAWEEFLNYAAEHCSKAAFANWLQPVKLLDISSEGVRVEVPNVFVKEYLLSNYKEDLCAFLPSRGAGQPAIDFEIGTPGRVESPKATPAPAAAGADKAAPFVARSDARFNKAYTFDNFIEGTSNQFVKSAAQGVAKHPGRSYNPLFIHGAVGLGKTHLLHSIGQDIKRCHRNARIQCLTTEGFINDFVDSLRKKEVESFKRGIRDVDVLLLDDVQFLQSRLNFEEELCNTLEALINQNKQIVISSDKPPGQLKLSERIVARMEWGLVANIGVPDLETRVAIILHKARVKGLDIPYPAAFYIAENIHHNVRQLEGALNRLSAHCMLLNRPVTQELVENTLKDLFQQAPQRTVSVEQILRSVAALFQVRVSEIKGSSRTKDIALARQVAMFLAKEMLPDPLTRLGVAMGGRTHSTILHACKNIGKKLEHDKHLRHQVEILRRNLQAV